MTGEYIPYILMSAVFVVLYWLAKILDALNEIKANSKQTSHLLSLLIDKISGRETF